MEKNKYPPSILVSYRGAAFYGSLVKMATGDERRMHLVCIPGS